MAKNKTKDEPIEYQAGAALVGEGIKFHVPFYFWLKLPLKVKPLHPGTIIMMSMQVSKLQPVNEQENMIAELLRSGENLRYICKVIAYACLNNPFKIALFGRLLAWHLKWKGGSTDDLLAYLQLAYRQMGASAFFFIMALSKGMNFLTAREANTGEAKQSGVQ